MTQTDLCRKWTKNEPLLISYHDNEWCKINHNDNYQFEMLCLEGASTGLSWKIIMHKRNEYKKVFFDFDIKTCSELSDEYLEKQTQNPGIIRNKNKIFSVRKNAKAVIDIQKEFGSFDNYLSKFINNKQIINNAKTPEEIPTSSDISKKLSYDLKKHGMSYVGPVITYSFMQAIGMINDHLDGCKFKFK